MADDPVADLLADLQRRIRALETAPRASHTTMRAGAIAYRGLTAEHAAIVINGSFTGVDSAMRINTEDDVNRAYFGTLSSGDHAVLLLDNPDKSGTVFNWSSSIGLNGPYGIGPWAKNPTQPIDALGITVTSSGSFEVGYRTLIYCTTPTVSVDYFVQLAGPTSAEVRLTAAVQHDDRGSHSPASSQAVFTRTVTSTSTYLDEAAIPASIWSPAASPVGTIVKLELTCRVAGGAGNVSWAPVLPAYLK